MEKAAAEVRCSACKRLITDLNCQRKRTLSESPDRKLKRQETSSRARLTYMSPNSRLKRQKNARSSRSNDKKRIAKLNSGDINIELSEEQHTEMCDITSMIAEDRNEELAKLFSESDVHGVGDMIRDIWKTDIKKQNKFMNDQAHNDMYTTINISYTCIYIYIATVGSKKS